MSVVGAEQQRGAAVRVGTCPQYLFLSDECHDAPEFEGVKYVMSPPLRPRASQERLWRGVVWNPQREFTWSASTHHMRVDCNPYEGRLVKGAPDLVLSRGRAMIEGGKFVGRAGAGQYLKRAAR